MKKFSSVITAVSILSLFLLSSLALAGEQDPFARDVVAKGWEYFNRGDMETALKRFHQATIIDPAFAPGYFGKAYIYSMRNNLDPAIENYRKTIELADPPFSHAYGNLGLILLMKGKKEEGHRMLLKALEIDPKNGEAHVNIAQSFCDRHDPVKAWDHIKQAYDLRAPVPSGLLNEMNTNCPKQ